jgi:hypothetical protein
VGAGKGGWLLRLLLLPLPLLFCAAFIAALGVPLPRGNHEWKVPRSLTAPSMRPHCPASLNPFEPFFLSLCAVGMPPVEAPKAVEADSDGKAKPKESLVSLLVNDCLK